MAEHSANQPKAKNYAFDLARAYACVVSVRTHIPEDAFTAASLGEERIGSGVVVHSDGLVLTIGYLITEAETIWLRDHVGNALQGHVVGYDPESGLGLVQPLGRLSTEVIPIGDSGNLRPGDPVIMAGFGGASGAVATEVIAVREFAGHWEYLLQHAIFTAPHHPGWGGAALIGSRGELVGIGSLFIQHGEGKGPTMDGNMSVPIDLLKPVFKDLATIGHPRKPPRPWLGLSGTEVKDRVVVAALTEGGPAARADIELGDVILKIAGQSVNALASMFRAIWALGPAGTEIPLTLSRNGEIRHASIDSVARADMLKKPNLH